jgi:hypothetical protein
MAVTDNAPQGEDNTPWYDKVSGFMGLGDNKTVDPNTGLTPQQQNLIGYNQLGSLGALLLAAGQKQMPSERAKYLAQIGSIPGQAMQQQAALQQAQLRGMQAQQLRMQLQGAQNLSEKMKTFMANGGQAAAGAAVPAQAGAPVQAGQATVSEAPSASANTPPIAATSIPTGPIYNEFGLTKDQTKLLAPIFQTNPAKAQAIYDDLVKQNATPKQFSEPFTDTNGRIVQKNFQTGQLVQVGNSPTIAFTGESAEAKASGEEGGKARAALTESADAAVGNIARLQLLKTVLANTKTGPTAQLEGNAAAWANRLGISEETLTKLGIDPKQPVNNAVADKIAAELVKGDIGAKNGGFPASNFSVAELGFIRNKFPNIQSQAGSNELVSEILIKREERTLEKQQEWSDYRQRVKAQGKNPSWEDFQDEWISKHKNDNIFADIQKRYEAGEYGLTGKNTGIANSKGQPQKSGPTRIDLEGKPL